MQFTIRINNFLNICWTVWELYALKLRLITLADINVSLVKHWALHNATKYADWMLRGKTINFKLFVFA